MYKTLSEGLPIGEVMSERGLRKAAGSRALPAVIVPADLTEIGFCEFTPTSKPMLDAFRERATSATPQEVAPGSWEDRWSVVALDEAELAATLASRKAAMIEDHFEGRAANLAEGFDYDFGDARGVHHIGTTPDDMKGWEEVTAVAQALIATGSGNQTIGIVTDTAPVEITAMEWQSILIGAAQFRQPIWAASFTYQAQIAMAADHDVLDALV